MTEAKLVSVYKCADGRNFPVEWPSAEAAARALYWDPEHNPTPCTPMDVVAWTESIGGSKRARREAGHPERPFFGETFTFVHGFMYWGETPEPEVDQALRRRRNAELAADYGDQLSFWESYCVPRIARAVEELREAPVEQPVSSLIDTYGYAFEHTFIFITEARADLERYLDARFGEEGKRLAIDLTQGQSNATIEADQALWEVAVPAGGDPELRSLLLSPAPPDLGSLPGTPAARDFTAALSRFMDRYGWRSLDWNPSSPTWRERPEVALNVVRATIENNLPEPAARTREAGRRREAVRVDIEQRLRQRGEDPSEFAELAAGVERYLPVKEGRALWQLTLAGSLRHALLRKGAFLAEAGLVDDSEDVFYLLPAEIDSALAPRRDGAGLRAAVKERRAERERWLGACPPERIGGEAPEPEEARRGELRGVGASRGVVTGRARVLSSFEEYERLAPGEVLVCAMTSPAWTPLFAVAAAVVSDGGGLLSHTAIAAREYGIPAVVGVRMATATIKDGAVITVDGTAGIVRIES